MIKHGPCVLEVYLHWTEHDWIVGANNFCESLVIDDIITYSTEQDKKTLLLSLIQVLCENHTPDAVRVCYSIHGGSSIPKAESLIRDAIDTVKPNLPITMVYRRNYSLQGAEDPWTKISDALLNYEESTGMRIHEPLSLQHPVPKYKKIQDRVLVFATDASRGHFHKEASWAFVPSKETRKILKMPYDLKFCSGMTRTESIHDAELLAIAHCVKYARSRKGNKVRILSDSDAAIRMITNNQYPPSANLRKDERMLIYFLRSEYKKRNVELRKVKGHSNNALNNMADKVALTTRRCSQARLSQEKVRKNVSNALNNMTQEELEQGSSIF